MYNFQFLIYAASEGNTGALHRLIALGRVAVESFSEALCAAARNGHPECVELLIPFATLPHMRYEALCEAVIKGHITCVELLLPVSNPQSHSSRTLQLAVELGHIEIAELLYPLSQPSSALRDLKCNFRRDYKMWGWLEDKIKGEQLAQRLSKTLNTKGLDAPRPKM